MTFLMFVDQTISHYYYVGNTSEVLSMQFMPAYNDNNLSVPHALLALFAGGRSGGGCCNHK
jgi:hypothetical protein